MKNETWWKILIILLVVALFVMASEEGKCESIYQVWNKVKPIELVDGSYMAIVTDGFQLYVSDPATGISPVDMRDPNELAFRLKELAYTYNWLHKKYYECQNPDERKFIQSTCEKLEL